jgi:prepilin-type processing-associated H-X9-DG protein
VPRPGLAFTLVEFLVCVAIVAALLGILFPAFAAAKASARQAASLSNIRQVGLAWLLYSEDASGVAMVPRAWLGGRKYAYWWASYDEATGVADETEGLLSPYTRDGRIQADPNWPDRLRTATGATGYGYNHRYLGTGRASVASLGDPAATVAFAASARVGFLPPHRLEGNTYLEPPSSGYPTFHGRANGYGAVAWADGHVASRAPDYRPGPAGSWPPGWFARHRLGDIDRDGDFATDELFDLD